MPEPEPFKPKTAEELMVHVSLQLSHRLSAALAARHKEFSTWRYDAEFLAGRDSQLFPFLIERFIETYFGLDPHSEQGRKVHELLLMMAFECASLGRKPMDALRHQYTRGLNPSMLNRGSVTTIDLSDMPEDERKQIQSQLETFAFYVWVQEVDEEG